MCAVLAAGKSGCSGTTVAPAYSAASTPTQVWTPPVPRTPTTLDSRGTARSIAPAQASARR